MINRTFLIVFLVLLASCKSSDTAEKLWIGDYLNHSGDIKLDTSLFYASDSILSNYDTIPNEFGWLLFRDVIAPLPIDSSRFKQTWAWDVDSVKLTLASMTNNWLDPDNQLSDNSIFMLVHFITMDSFDIAGTFYLDFDSDIIGTYTMGYDSIKGITIKDSVRVSDLKEKLKLTK